MDEAARSRNICPGKNRGGRAFGARMRKRSARARSTERRAGGCTTCRGGRRNTHATGAACAFKPRRTTEPAGSQKARFWLSLFNSISGQLVAYAHARRRFHACFPRRGNGGATGPGGECVVKRRTGRAALGAPYCTGARSARRSRRTSQPPAARTRCATPLRARDQDGYGRGRWGLPTSAQRSSWPTAWTFCRWNGLAGVEWSPVRLALRPRPARPNPAVRPHVAAPCPAVQQMRVSSRI